MSLFIRERPMLPSTRGLVLTVAMASAGSDAMDVAQHPMCLMEPSRRSFTLPERGVVTLTGDEAPRPCEPVPARSWVRTSAGTTDLMVHADGPGGSGRYWTVTVGVAPRQQAAPTRGFCLETTTIGWRTLQRFTPTPLRWTGDADRDGRPEFVLWDSFALKRNDPVADFALMAWVYEFDGRSTLAIDWAMSRTVARDLMAAYRAPLRDGSARLETVRTEAARQLESFAEGRCTQPMDGAR